MTRHEQFKRRVRARMERTGERYAAARRQLLAGQPTGARTWVSPPEMTDDRVVATTGRGWNDWCDVIDAGPGRDAGHPAIARWLQDEHDVDPWWAQAVTVGYERIVGLRLPNQRADGTFVASRSKTITVDGAALRRYLLDEGVRADLFPGEPTELRSQATSKGIRLGMGLGVALISIVERPDGRCTVTVAHEKLPTPDDVDRWRHYWTEWLEALDEG